MPAVKRRYLVLSTSLLILFCTPTLAHEHETQALITSVQPATAEQLGKNADCFRIAEGAVSIRNGAGSPNS